ncbi:MAG TPA: Uma2 family endonuclease [Cyanothece sp. UBA12306]|nr:Uma2 family endonuclease [Cyanothece sp. UBA12306]
MITARKITLEEFLALPEEGVTYELIAGEAIPKVSPKRFHSRLAVTLCIFLENWSKNKGEVGIEWSVILKRNGENWVPVPDLLYISYEKLPRERFEDEACPFPPELAIEIISPGQSFGDLTEKATAYLKAGICRVWLVDPQGKSITIFYPDAPPITKRGEDSLSDEILPGLAITVKQIFEQAGLL